MSEINDKLTERRKAIVEQMKRLAQDAVSESRDLSADEQGKFDAMDAEVGNLDKRLSAFAEEQKRALDIEESFRRNSPKDEQRGQGNEASKFVQWARSAGIGDSYEVAGGAGAERRALEAYRGEQRAMSASNGLGNDSVYSQLWEYAVAGSQILQAGVDVISTSDGNTLPFPVVTSHAQGASAAANAALTASDATLSTVNLSVTKQQYITLVPSELLQDATFDLEGYIARAAGRELGRQVTSIAEAALIAGFTTSGATAPSASVGASGGAVFSDALISLFHSVLPEYRPTASWVSSDPTIAAIRKAKDGLGQYVWQSALTAGDPDLVLGRSIYASPTLPSPTGTSKIVYFGDFSALKVRIAGGLRFERSVDYQFGNDQVAFRAVVRTGAAVVDPNAVKFLQLTAT